MEPLAEGLTREFKQVLSAAAERVPADGAGDHDPQRGADPRRVDARPHTGEYDPPVMGSRGRGMLSSSLLGSVSHYALNHSTVPVLIIHSPDEDARESEQDHGVAESVQAPQVALAVGGPAGVSKGGYELVTSRANSSSSVAAGSSHSPACTSEGCTIGAGGRRQPAEALRRRQRRDRPGARPPGDPGPEPPDAP